MRLSANEADFRPVPAYRGNQTPHIVSARKLAFFVESGTINRFLFPASVRHQRAIPLVLKLVPSRVFAYQGDIRIYLACV